MPRGGTVLGVWNLTSASKIAGHSGKDSRSCAPDRISITIELLGSDRAWLDRVQGSETAETETVRLEFGMGGTGREC
eukprot:2537272-Rhodomonas_salina.1